MAYVIVALFVVIAWQHARYLRVQADSVLLAGQVESLTEQVDYLDMAAYENGVMADEYADALLQRSYICNGCGHVIPDSVSATQRVEVGGKMAGKVTYSCADCVREAELDLEGGYCPTGDGSDGDDEPDTQVDPEMFADGLPDPDDEAVAVLEGVARLTADDPDDMRH
jgi:DNA-directed RNA polymerase subunit RPC12/RpoP